MRILQGDGAQHVETIWSGASDLAREVNAEDPSPERVRAAIEILAQGFKACLKWAGAKADLIVDTTIKWAVPVGGGGYIAVNPAKVRHIIELAERWLALLP